MTLRLGVPSKGRLMSKTFDWFSERSIQLSLSGTEREYSGRVDGVANVSLVLVSAGEIPRELASGRLHLGVTGTDMVRDRIPNWHSKVSEISTMGFGHADLVLAVPRFWVDVNSVHDLDAVAAQFRDAHGFRLRIATKYHRLVREFLRDEGVSDYQLVDSQGATEGTVANYTAEAIADITSTGETLRANHLKILSDGTIHSSQATLLKSLSANWSPDAMEAYEAILAKLGLGH